MSKIIRISLIFLSSVILSVSAYAQVTTSSLNGLVTDSAGQPLAGAVITAIHTPTGSQYYAVANEKGHYVINGMRAGGPYTVDFTFLGMTARQNQNVYLQLGESTEINSVMESQSELEAVTIIADKSFNATKTGAAQAFNQKQIEQLPSMEHSVYDIVKFTPQASISKNGGISFTGSNNRYNSFQVDGAVNNDSFGLSSTGTNGGQTNANPISLETIEEIQVAIAPFDVRQSGFTGGAINAITKSGTNQVKGSAYMYIHNQDFIGTTAGDVKTRTKYSEQLTQTYGFTIGAPIVKNKLFVFASAEYNQKSVPCVYTPANHSYDGITLKQDVEWGGVNYGNVFTTDLADAMIAKYGETYASKVPGYSESYSQHQVNDRSWNILTRVDWNINKDHKLMIRYQYLDATSDSYGKKTPVSNAYAFNNSSYKFANKTNTIVAELNSRIGDRMSNQFRATGVFVRDRRSPGYPGATVFIQDNMYFNIGTEASSGANSMSSDTYTITDNFNIFAGNHNITLGTHNEFFKFNNVFLQYAYGQYSFATLADFFNDNWNKYDYKFSDPQYTGGDTRWGAPTYALELGLYAQDEWKVNSDFTLTYGLRMDVPMILNTPTANDAFNGTVISQVSREKVGVVPEPQPLFSPRIGFRWYTDKAHTSLLRGGLGLFTGRVPFVWLSNAFNNTGMETKSITIAAKTHGADVLAGIPATSDPYNDVIPYLKGQGIDASAAGATINTLNKNFKYPQVFRVNLGYDKEFEGGWKITLDALYSKNLNNVFFSNLAISRQGTVYGVNPSVPASAAPYYGVINKDYSAIIALSNTNRGFSYSLSAQVQKHFDFGLDLMASYTYGHSYSVCDGTSSIAYSNWKYNFGVDTNSPDELSYSQFDIPHKVNAVISYTSPVYAKVLRTGIALTYTGQSGQRYSYTMNEAVDFNGDGYKGNSVMYIPTQSELAMMSWATPEDAAGYEAFIRGDKYLNSHRGEWSKRSAGIDPFENHFDLQISEDVFYDRKHGRKIQILVNFINIGNLLCRNWGLYYEPALEGRRTVLNVDSMADDGNGNLTPTYSFSSVGITYNDFYSRWRCQIGARITF